MKLKLATPVILLCALSASAVRAQGNNPGSEDPPSSQASQIKTAETTKIRKMALITPPDRRVTVRLESGERLRGHIWEVNNDSIQLAVEDPHPGFLAAVYDQGRAPTTRDVPFGKIASIKADSLIGETAREFGRLAFIGAAVPLSFFYSMGY